MRVRPSHLTPISLILDELPPGMLGSSSVKDVENVKNLVLDRFVNEQVAFTQRCDSS